MLAADIVVFQSSMINNMARILFLSIKAFMMAYPTNEPSGNKILESKYAYCELHNVDLLPEALQHLDRVAQKELQMTHQLSSCELQFTYIKRSPCKDHV